MDKQSQNESLEESVFKTLSHQTRRDILRVIGEQKQVTFTEIKNNLKIEDSATLSYHINTLAPLVIQESGKYSLSELGQNAYTLISKTAVYTESNSTLNFLRGRIPLAIVVNAILWVFALLLTSQFEEKLTLDMILGFDMLWIISNLVLSSLLFRVGRKNCFIRG
jgi:hypothetical protein